VTQVDGSEAIALYRESVLSCTACTARADATKPVPCAYPLYHEDNPRILVVGRNPGRQEDRVGEPFVGASGGLLNTWLTMAGLAREADVVITNLVKCFTADNRPPRANEIGTCQRFLAVEMALFDPRLVILLGQQVTEHVLGYGTKFSDVRGQIIPRNKRDFFATYHPSAALRSVRNKNVFLSDSTAVLRYLEGVDWWPTS
jgi:DNA polymerase